MERRRLKNILLILINVILIFLIVFLYVTKPKFNVLLNGEDVKRYYEIGVYEEFNPTVSAKYLNKDISNEVIKIGDYDNTKLGEYKIVYQLSKNIYKMNKTIFIKVVDRVAPVISLTGANEVQACSLESYVEDGYKAEDNFDGDITNMVEVKRENDTVYYIVSDSSNNVTTEERKVISTDKEAPKIEVNKDKRLYIKLNDTYTEYSARVSDNCDKNIDLITSGSVDTSKTGHYIINYSASDSTGNKSTAIRDIFVYDPASLVDSGVEGKGVIYLTFDDGPSAYTPKILDILSKYGIKATFFVTNSGKDDYIKREYKEGHTVALHTASHSYKKVYSSVDAYFSDLNSVSNRVFNLTGVRSMIIRFPGGSSNTVSKNYKKGIMTTLTDEVLKRGYHYFDWNISVEDAGSCGKKKSDSDKKSCMYNYFVKGLSKNRSNVVLMHDVKYYTADKLEDMIKYAIENGYSFDKITMETKQVHHKVNN